MSNSCRICLLVLAALLLFSGGHPLAWADEPGAKPTVKYTIDKGIAFLKSQQKEDGSWENDVGITSLAITTFLRCPRTYKEDDGPFMKKPIQYILNLQKPDGGIYDMHLQSYNTSVALMALAEVKNASYESNIKRAQDFLANSQSDETQGYAKEDKYYGGIGYGNDLRPDLSNLQLALEALKVSSASPESAVWTGAITFLQRCQNRSESNDQPWAGNDGGFVYNPGHLTLDKPISYGSMTYAGIKSYVYAGLTRDDPRVKAAYDWIMQHYTLEENPNMSADGLFYYYHTFAKTFSLLGEKEITDAQGVKHNWGAELEEKLISLQNPEGWWSNDKSGRWWENNKVLATSYALLALEEVSKAYGGEPKK